MSRLGKLPIELSDKTEASVTGSVITVKGPKGELKQDFLNKVNVEIKDNNILVTVNNSKDREQRAYWGLYRTLIYNMVKGVEEGFEKKLEINGVGYRVAVSGDKLTLNVGFSHPAEYKLPEGISASVEGNVITISGIDKQLVGEVAGQIRRIKKVEPYKGKGIKYEDEVVIRKEGKASSKE